MILELTAKNQNLLHYAFPPLAQRRRQRIPSEPAVRLARAQMQRKPDLE